MSRYDLILRSRRTVTPEGERPAAVCVAGERIAAVEGHDAELDAATDLDVGDGALLPGAVDTHVHVNEPGRTEWEGFATATRAAAAGGITTIIDMPLNCVPPTVDPAALETKRNAAGGRCAVDVGFWGGAVPENMGNLGPLHEAGVFGFKSFLLHSGVEEFPYLHPSELETALRELAQLDKAGAMMIVHAEDSAAIDHAPTCHGERYRDFLASRPREAENLAIAQVIELARKTGARVHILHLSSSDALPLVASAKRDGVAVTVETCPHFLFFTAEEVPDGATEYKCCPPVREAENREQLWRGLAEGTIDCVVSDHSPCAPELKRFDSGDFGTAWGGISSLQLDLPAVWTQARRRGHGLTDLARWMAERPAQLAGLHRKGRIAVGYDADLTVFAPDEAFVVDPAALHHKHPVTPYADRPLAGTVRETWLRGQRVEPAGGERRGKLLTRGEA